MTRIQTSRHELRVKLAESAPLTLFFTVETYGRAYGVKASGRFYESFTEAFVRVEIKIHSRKIICFSRAF